MTEERASDAPGEREVTARRGDLFSTACPTRRLLDRIGTKWVSMIVKLLHDARLDALLDARLDSGASTAGEVRFAELRRRAPGISQKMLSQTLTALVADGLVHRRVEDLVPPAVHYSLTPLGESLAQPLEILRDWAETSMVAVDTHRLQAAASGGNSSKPNDNATVAPGGR